MAANSNLLLSKLCEQLVSVYEVSVTRRKHAERTVRDYRELLRPWPRKPQPKALVEPSASNLGSASQETPGQAADNKEEEEVPAAERAALDLAEEALAQAQRLWQKQAKALAREKADLNQGTHSSGCKDQSQQSPSSNSLKHETNSTRSLTRKLRELTLGSNIKPESKPVRVALGQNGSSTNPNLTRPQSKTILRQRPDQRHSRVVEKTGHSQAVQSKGQPPRVASGTTSGSNRNQLSNRLQNETVGVISQSALKRVLGQHQSKPTANSSAVRHCPAHIAAPFRTQSAAPRVKNRPTRTSELRQGRVSDLRVAGTQSSKTGRERADETHPAARDDTLMGDSDSSSNKPPCDKVMDRVTAKEIMTPPPQMHWSAEGESGKGHCGDVPVPVDDTTRSVSGSVRHLRACEQLDGACDDPGGTAEPPPFELLVDGHTLTLPLKFRKLMSVNNKLRRQLETAALTFHASRENSPTSSFLNKLVNHYDSKVDPAYKDAVQTLALYKRLTALMEKLHQQRCDGGTTWQEVLRAKRTMENICLLYADMEDNFNQCVDGVDEHCHTPDTRMAVSDVQPITVWLPAEIPTGLPRLPAVLRYNRLRDAERYLELLHDAQLLALRRHLTGVMADTLLPLLDTMDATHSSFHPVYRATYSLLCTERQRQPIIIGDSD